MNPVNIQKMAIAFALLAFGILGIGSVLMGSRVITGVIRGGLGAVIFGALIWVFADLFLAEDEGAEIQDIGNDGDNNDKGTQLDQTA